MKIKISLFIVALLIVVGMQMVSADTGYPVDGDYGYPIDYGFVEDPYICDHAPQFSHGVCDEIERKLPPPAQPVVESTPAINQNIVNRIMATNQLLRANQIRRPLVIPVRNVLDNLFRFELVK